MTRTLFATLFAIILCPTLAAQTVQRGGAAGAPRPVSTPAQTPPTPAPAKVDDCGCEAETPPDVLAVVNGVKITSKEIEDPIRDQVQQLRQQVTEARKNELERQINRTLLEAEAKRRGVIAEKLLEQEVVAKTPEPTAAEAQAFYDQNRARIQGEFKDVQDDIISYLRYQRQQEMAKKLAEGLRAAAQVKVLVAEPTAPTTAAARARVFAEVNGKQITSAMIEDALKPAIHSAQTNIYRLRKQQLDLRVNDLLLGQEAQKRQVTPNALINAEIEVKLKPVTEADARTFYEQNRERINGNFAQLKNQIVEYLNQQQQQQLSADFAEKLRRAASLQLFLREPPAPVYEIATDDQPSKGVPSAPVTVVEFTDFQCPHCATFQSVLERIVREYGDRVRLVVRDFPLQQHTDAFKAAEAAEAAREQGRYWEYAALLFANQQALGVAQLKEYATRLGLDRAKFDAALDSGRFAASVARDVSDANRVGVNATPTFFVNGRPVEDLDYESLKAAIDAALKFKGRG